MRSPARGFKTAAFLFLTAATLVAVNSFAGPILDNIEKTVIYNYEGEPTLVRNGKPPQPVALDMRCLKGDIYKTTDKGSMDIVVPGVMGIRLLSSTGLKIVTVQKTLLEFAMTSGDVLIKTIDKLPEGTVIRIDTPNSSVSATVGAQFWVSVRPGPAGTGSFSAVRKGRIATAIIESSAEVTVIEGRVLDVPADTYIPNSRNASEEEFKALNECNQVPLIDPENA